MLISVMYQDNKMGMVDDSKLDELIFSNKIKQFLRSDGWVAIGDDPIRRRNRDDYKGRERRFVSAGDKQKREDMEMPKEVLKEMFGEKAEQTVDPQVKDMIDDMHQKYEGLGYYGVLGVKDYAPADEIKKAYYKIARKFHPDMHFHLDDASLKDELSDIFAFIYKAYATLSDPQKRKDYDEWMTLKPTKLTSNPDKARAKFEEGKGELRRNKYSEAELLFGQATYFDSTVAEYHYYYGLLLMKQKKIKEAEKALRKALQLEPANANYLAELGSVYLELGFPTRAKGFFERALEISPDNVRALEGLSKKPVCLTSRQDQFNSCHLYYAES